MKKIFSILKTLMIYIVLTTPMHLIGPLANAGLFGGDPATGDIILTRKIITQEADFPVPISGKIPLEDGVHYAIDRLVSLGPLDITNGFDVSQLTASRGCKISSTVSPGSHLRYTGVVDMFGGTLNGRLSLDGLTFSCPSATMFNLNGPFTGIVGMSDFTILGAKSLGTFPSTSIDAQRGFVAFVGNGLQDATFVGFDINGSAGTFCSFKRVTFTSWLNNQTDMIKFRGTISVLNITECNFNPNANEYSLNFDAGLILPSGDKVKENTFLARPLNPTSRDQTDPYLNFQGNEGVADSMVTGSFYMNGNTTQTTFAKQGADGTITAFADAGGGSTTCSSTLAGLSNGDYVSIKDSDDYRGTYIISGVVPNTSFDILKAFVGTDTATLEVGWTVILGTVIAGADNERCELISNNRLEFKNISEQTISSSFHMSATTVNASAKDYQFAVFKNGYRIDNAKTPVTIFDSDITFGYVATEKAADGDIVEIRVRNMTNTIATTISNVQFVNN